MCAITLIGMPGAGKSTVGAMLAKELNYDFLDLDVLIKEREGKDPHRFIKEYGEEAFLQLEEALVNNLEISNFKKGLVFAPGGSIVYSAPAMEKLRNESKVFYLELPLKTIQNRLGDLIGQRGVIGLNKKGIFDLYNERTQLYRQYTHYTLNCAGCGEKEIVKGILWHL
jgi:shikimate kinase